MGTNWRQNHKSLRLSRQRVIIRLKCSGSPHVCYFSMQNWGSLVFPVPDGLSSCLPSRKGREGESANHNELQMCAHSLEISHRLGTAQVRESIPQRKVPHNARDVLIWKYQLGWVFFWGWEKGDVNSTSLLIWAKLIKNKIIYTVGDHITLHTFNGTWWSCIPEVLCTPSKLVS